MICPYCKSENRPGAVKCAACASWMVEYPPVREWYRVRERRMIAGVCRGLANRFGLPIAALRLAFVLSLLLGGWGLIVYVALWIAMPLPPRVDLAPVTAPPPPTPPRAPDPQPHTAA
jgi:phage shock protein PspC (stress-responsive transcriptional regulator)